MGVTLQDPKYDYVLHCKTPNKNTCYIARPQI